MNPIYASRRRTDIVIRVLCIGAAAFGVTWLALILFTLFYNGLTGLSLQVFTKMTPPPGANEVTEAVGDIYTSSLIALGLILFIITFIVLACARLMLARMDRRSGT